MKKQENDYFYSNSSFGLKRIPFKAIVKNLKKLKQIASENVTEYKEYDPKKDKK